MQNTRLRNGKSYHHHCIGEASVAKSLKNGGSPNVNNIAEKQPIL